MHKAFHIAIKLFFNENNVNSIPFKNASPEHEIKDLIHQTSRVNILNKYAEKSYTSFSTNNYVILAYLELIYFVPVYYAHAHSLVEKTHVPCFKVRRDDASGYFFLPACGGAKENIAAYSSLKYRFCANNFRLGGLPGWPHEQQFSDARPFCCAVMVILILRPHNSTIVKKKLRSINL